MTPTRSQEMETLQEALRIDDPRGRMDRSPESWTTYLAARKWLTVLSAPTVRWCKVHESPNKTDDMDECDTAYTLDWVADSIYGGKPPGPCEFTTLALVPMEDGE